MIGYAFSYQGWTFCHFPPWAPEIHFVEGNRLVAACVVATEICCVQSCLVELCVRVISIETRTQIVWPNDRAGHAVHGHDWTLWEHMCRRRDVEAVFAAIFCDEARETLTEVAAGTRNLELHVLHNLDLFHHAPAV